MGVSRLPGCVQKLLEARLGGSRLDEVVRTNYGLFGALRTVRCVYRLPEESNDCPRLLTMVRDLLRVVRVGGEQFKMVRVIGK
ncbi:hypothetical protein CASFOL_014604 [Castilleja foliolosa]|uniref:Uncharacterized protein n=1 Tax=Castilleja foliolosa TaxID=1961234 RepID=A0ABD3DS27_9LAMI